MKQYNLYRNQYWFLFVYLSPGWWYQGFSSCLYGEKFVISRRTVCTSIDNAVKLGIRPYLVDFKSKRSKSEIHGLDIFTVLRIFLKGKRLGVEMFDASSPLPTSTQIDAFATVLSCNAWHVINGWSSYEMLVFPS